MKEELKKYSHKIYVKGKNLQSFIQNEKGEGILGALGWGVVIVTIITVAHGLISGWLPTFIETKIFDRMDSL
jgi:hypothetical protein